MARGIRSVNVEIIEVKTQEGGSEEIFINDEGVVVGSVGHTAGHLVRLLLLCRLHLLLHQDR